MSILIGRYINGICLNELEYLLDDRNVLIEFESKDKAKQHLTSKIKNVVDDDLEDCFLYVDKETGEIN